MATQKKVTKAAGKRTPSGRVASQKTSGRRASAGAPVTSRSAGKTARSASGKQKVRERSESRATATRAAGGKSPARKAAPGKAAKPAPAKPAARQAVSPKSRTAKAASRKPVAGKAASTRPAAGKPTGKARSQPVKPPAPRPQPAAVKKPKPKAESRKGPDVYTLYEKALAALHQEDYQNAQTVFEGIIRDYPQEIELLARVQSFLKICHRHLEKRRPQKSAEVLFDIGVVHHNDGHYREAAAKFKKALDLSGKDTDHIYYALAATEVCQGNHREALKFLKQAIDLNDENRFFAANDPDFRILSRNEEFRKLIEQ